MEPLDSVKRVAREYRAANDDGWPTREQLCEDVGNRLHLDLSPTTLWRLGHDAHPGVRYPQWLGLATPAPAERPPAESEALDVREPPSLADDGWEWFNPTIAAMADMLVAAQIAQYRNMVESLAATMPDRVMRAMGYRRRRSLSSVNGFLSRPERFSVNDSNGSVSRRAGS